MKPNTRGQMFAISAYYKKFNGPIVVRQSSDNLHHWRQSQQGHRVELETSGLDGQFDLFRNTATFKSIEQ